MLRIPRSAVVSSGARDMVFISRGRGRFEPREVSIGATDSSGYVVVNEGLSEGESVVISGQFLIDAESRMIESLARIINPDGAATPKPTASTPPAVADDKASDNAPMRRCKSLGSLRSPFHGLVRP